VLGDCGVNASRVIGVARRWNKTTRHHGTDHAPIVVNRRLRCRASRNCNMNVADPASVSLPVLSSWVEFESEQAPTGPQARRVRPA
jgi:hypothetical protein